MRKPSWFQPLDLIPLLFAVGCAVYAFVVGYEAEHRVEAGALLVVVPVLMCAIWGYGMWRRKKFLDSCVWYPAYRIMLQPEDWLPPASQEFEYFIQRVAASWRPFYPTADLLLRSRVKWVYMRKNMDEKPINPNWGLAKGITIAGGSVLYVNYNDRFDTIERTAMAHELGHVIQGLATSSWSQAEHHAFSKKNHLR